MAIKLIVDSTSDIPAEIMKKLDLEVVPLTVNFEDKCYLDKIEITSQEFFKKLAEVETLPTTSQASPGQFIEVFEKVLNEENEILGIFVSSKFSGTYESARIAKDIIGSDKIHIVDSQTACLGSCLLILEAVKLVESGLDIHEIINRLEQMKGKVLIYAGVDTLKYLEKGGRLSKGAATIGTLLNIKPILRVKDSNIEAIDKVRGRNKILSWLEDQIKNNINVENKTVAIYHTANEELAITLKNTLVEKYNAKDIIIGEVGSVIGAHVGPNAIIIGYIED